MIKIENIDVEFPQMGKEPKVGYETIYQEYIMMSGKIKRIEKGKRFVASFSYAYLTADQRSTIQELLTTQKLQGYLAAQISTPQGTFIGNVIIDINSDQSRFAYSEVLQDYVWTNWSFTAKAVDLT